MFTCRVKRVKKKNVTEAQFRRRTSAVGSAKARQKNNFHSNVVPESHQIQDLLKSRKKSPNLAKPDFLLIDIKSSRFYLFQWEKFVRELAFLIKPISD